MEVPPELIALAVLLAANRWVLPGRILNGWVYWPITAANLASLVYVVVHGVSGVEGYYVVRWLVAAVIAVHLVQNLSLRDRARHDADMAERRRRP